MKFVSLASSSKGNSAYISYKNTNILVDAGISKKRIEESLSVYGKSLKDIDFIFITHSHEDHIKALPYILKEYKNLNVYSQIDTLKSIVSYCEYKGIDVNFDNLRILRPVNFENEGSFILAKDIKVIPIKGNHDVPSLYYKFILGDIIVAIITDMGTYTDYTIRSILDVNYLMLECNYDIDMLMSNEKYSPYLKNRILGKEGHLSNVDTANIIMKISSKNLKKVFLSHISEENNSEEYALSFVKKYIEENKVGNIVLPEIHVSKRLSETVIVE